jgi:hypothetical protein
VDTIDDNEDEYEDALQNDLACVRLEVNGDDIDYFSPLSCWPKAIHSVSCNIDFTFFLCISQPLFNYTPPDSHRDFLMMKVSTIPAPTNTKNCSKCIGGLRFLCLLCVTMDVMLISTTALDNYCANHAARQYMLYAFKCGLPFAEFRKLMQHQQATRYSNYTNAIIWQQCKNVRYKLQNEVLPHYNQVGSGMYWHEQRKQVISGIWKQIACDLNVINAKEKHHNFNQVPPGWIHPHLWWVFSSCAAEEQLNVSGSIVTLSGTEEGDDDGSKSAVNKIQAQGMSREESRKWIKGESSKLKAFMMEDA